MIEAATFGVFLTAAIVLAVVPGPGMLYVLARTLKGGRREGLNATLGTALAGLIHTVLAAAGISAVLAASAVAFTVLKWAGAAYLLYLGIRTIVQRDGAAASDPAAAPGAVFGQSLLTELLNPKTAIFFLAFIPQFINPAAGAFVQFLLLGAITTLLTSGTDLLVVFTAGALSGLLLRNRRLRALQRATSGGTMIGLGLYVALSE